MTRTAREVGCWFGKRWSAYLIAENPLRRITGQRTITGEAQVALGASDEEGSCQNDPSQSCKIHVTAIHHIEGTCLEEKPVEPENIGLAGYADMDAGRDRASQIELGVYLDPGFGGAKVGPCSWPSILLSRISKFKRVTSFLSRNTLIMNEYQQKKSRSTGR